MRNPTRLLLVLGIIVVLVSAANRAAAQPTQPAPPQPEQLTPAPTAGENDEGQEAQVGDDDEKNDKPAGEEQGARPADRRSWFEKNSFFFIMIGAFVLLYLWMGRSRRRQESKRKEMLSNLKKGDKVTSIGGIIGTVIEVRDDEVTVKVDETNNVRMKFVRRAIQSVGEEARSQGDQQR